MPFQNIAKTIAVTVAFGLIPGAVSYAQSPQEAIVESWLSTADGVEFLKLTHGGVSHDASSNVTTISDLTLQFQFDSAHSKLTAGDVSKEARGKLDYSISFPTAQFTNLALENGYYSAGSIRADIANLKMDITGDEAASSTATGVYDEFELINVSWAKPPDVANDPSKPISKYYPLVEALFDVSFDSASLGGMTLSQSMGDPAMQMDLIYGPMTAGRAVKGNFSEMIVAGVKLVVQPPAAAGPQVDVSIGELSVTGYNYGTLIRNFAPGMVAASDSEPYRQFIGEFVMNELKVNAEGGSFSLDLMAMNDVGVRPSRMDILGQADRLFQMAMAGQSEPDEKKIIELVASGYGAFRLGSFEMAGMKFNAPGNVAQGKLDRYRIADLSADGLGEFLIEGVNAVGPNGEYVNVDHFSLSDIKFPSLDALLNLEEAGRKEDILAIMQAIPTLAGYTLRGADVRIPNEGEFSLGEATMDMADFIGPVPTNLGISVSDVKMPVAQLEREQREVLSAMGFTDINFSYMLNAAWDQASQVLLINTSANLVDGGAIDADVSVGGIPRSAFENPMTAQNLIAQVTVNSANLSFDDQSIVDKGLALVAAQQGTDAETLKAQAVGMLPFMLQVLKKPAFVNELSVAVKTFLDTKGVISASAKPAAPVSIIQLMGVGQSNPGAVIDLLNVKVQAQ